MSIMRRVQNGQFKDYGRCIPMVARTLTDDPSESVPSTPRTMDIVYGPYSKTDRGATRVFGEWPCFPDWRYSAYTFRYRNQGNGQEECLPMSRFKIASYSPEPVLQGGGIETYFRREDSTFTTGWEFVTPCPPAPVMPHRSDNDYCYANYWDENNWHPDQPWLCDKHNYTANTVFFNNKSSYGSGYSLAIGDAFHDACNDTILYGAREMPLYFARIQGAWDESPSSGSSWSNSVLGANQLYIPEHWMIFSTSEQIDPRCFALDMDVMYVSKETHNSIGYNWFDFWALSNRSTMTVLPRTGMWRGHSRMGITTPSAGTTNTSVCFQTPVAYNGGGTWGYGKWSDLNYLKTNHILGKTGCKYKYLGQFNGEHFHMMMNVQERTFPTAADIDLGEHLSFFKSEYPNLPDAYYYEYISPPMLSFYYNTTGVGGTTPYLPLGVEVKIYEWGVDFWGEGKYGGWTEPATGTELRGWRRKAMTSG